jgi:hypothetical protein
MFLSCGLKRSLGSGSIVQGERVHFQNLIWGLADFLRDE